MKFLDIHGLTRTGGHEYADSLGIEAERVELGQRLDLLKRLRNGAGVYVYTGPEGAPFWQAVSHEVHVRIVPDDVEYTERREPDMVWALQAVGLSGTLARGLVRHYGDGSPTDRARTYPQWQEAKRLLASYHAHQASPSIVIEASHIEVVTDPQEQLQLIANVTNAAMDFEWDIDTLEPEAMSIATSDRTWYLPLVAADFAAPAGQSERIRRVVADTLRRTPTVWHNAKADIKAQYQGEPLELFGAPIHDTMVMAYLCGETDLALKPLTKKFLDRDPLGYPGSMRQYPLEVGKRYGGADSRNTYDLFGVLWAELGKRNQLGIYENIERPIIPILADMEKYGHPIDPNRTNVLIAEFLEIEEAIRARFMREDGLDISKDDQTRELVKRRAGYDPGTCDKKALSKIPADWMTELLKYRQTRHQRRSFLVQHMKRWEDAGRPDDFRLYTNFNQAGSPDRNDFRSFRSAPRSGRLSSSGGVNLQNQPSSIRTIFSAPRDRAVWCVDYSQLELRIAAVKSGDVALTEFLKSGDPHGMFQQKIKELTGVDITRTAAKQGNFNASYGGHVDMLRTILQLQRAFPSDQELQAVVDAHKATYVQYHQYTEDVIQFARLSGYAETSMGRRRYEPDIYSGDQRLSLHAGRALVNHTIQGSAADMLKQAMALTVPVLRKYNAHMAIQAHDEMEGWVEERAARDFIHDLRVACAPAALPGLDFPIKWGVGATWKEAKDCEYD